MPRNDYDLHAHKTISGALARAKQLEANVLTEASTHLDAIAARTAPALSKALVDYSAWEVALEELVRLVEGCGGLPSKLARAAAESHVVKTFIHALYPGRAINGPLMMQVINDALFQAYMRDREILLVYGAQMEAFKVIAENAAEIMIRDVRTRNALSVRGLLKAYAEHPATPVSKQVQAALKAALEEDGADDVLGDVGGQAWQGPRSEDEG
jgi:hypothetical protein